MPVLILILNSFIIYLFILHWYLDLISILW